MLQARESEALGQSLGRILLVEDDERLAALMRDYLEAQRFSVVLCARGDEAVERFDAAGADLVILDLMLPGLDGLAVCRHLRQRFDGPILILTAKNSDIDHVMGLELGADDFVNKPIEPPVLLARIRALLRRRTRPPGQREARTLRFGGLLINLDSHQVRLDGAEVELTTQEFDLLALLAGHAGRVLSREEILNQLRGIDYDGLDRSVDVRVSRLRRKLGDNTEQPFRIKTIWGKGYLFVADAWNRQD